MVGFFCYICTFPNLLSKFWIMVNDEYISPEIEVVEILLEGFLCTSGYAPGSNNSDLI